MWIVQVAASSAQAPWQATNGIWMFDTYTRTWERLQADDPELDSCADVFSAANLLSYEAGSQQTCSGELWSAELPCPRCGALKLLPLGLTGSSCGAVSWPDTCILGS